MFRDSLCVLHRLPCCTALAAQGPGNEAGSAAGLPASSVKGCSQLQPKPVFTRVSKGVSVQDYSFERPLTVERCVIHGDDTTLALFPHSLAPIAPLSIPGFK
ncbi:unnamed protein product [Arctogadus glacialis]